MLHSALFYCKLQTKINQCLKERGSLQKNNQHKPLETWEIQHMQP